MAAYGVVGDKNDDNEEKERLRDDGEDMEIPTHQVVHRALEVPQGRLRARLESLRA